MTGTGTGTGVRGGRRRGGSLVCNPEEEQVCTRARAKAMQTHNTTAVQVCRILKDTSREHDTPPEVI